MIPEFGLFSLILALLLSSVLMLLPPLGVVYSRFAYLQNLARPSAMAICLFVVLSFCTGIACFVQNDFSVEYIAQNSHSTLPLVYRFCAMWGAHEGSLLLWACILSLWTLAVALFSRQLSPAMQSTTLAILGAINVGFLLLILQTSNPFLRLPVPAADGADLNPLLQDPGFVIHPPFLYMGYVGFAVPFAFALAGMLVKDYQSTWSQLARPWALLAWAFLTLGITLGSWWAYYELGWGGWWFWDPVENASFMPWLLGTALVHALNISARSRFLMSWSALLAICTFVLSLMGTFLVRSGVISSVHMFASDPLRGVFILAFLAIVLVGAFGIYLKRFPKNTNNPSHLFSKQSLIVLGNMILFVTTLSILLGTLFPLFMEVINDKKMSVGPPFFNSVFLPLVLPLLLLMVITPYVHWDEDNLKALWQRIKKPAAMLILLLPAWFLMKTLSWFTIAWTTLGSVLVLATIMLRNSKRTLPKLGMTFAHIGIGLATMGVALTTALQTEKELKMAVGETVVIQDHQFTFIEMKNIEGSNYQGRQGHFIVKQNQSQVHMYPEKRYFIPREIPMTETAIDAGLLRDIYIALGESLGEGSWSVRIYIKPFVRWIWLGGILIALGASCSAISAFREGVKK